MRVCCLLAWFCLLVCQHVFVWVACLLDCLFAALEATADTATADEADTANADAAEAVRLSVCLVCRFVGLLACLFGSLGLPALCIVRIWFCLFVCFACMFVT